MADQVPIYCVQHAFPALFLSHDMLMVHLFFPGHPEAYVNRQTFGCLNPLMSTFNL